MKKFFAFFVFFVALIFAVSCGGSSKSNDQTEARDCDSQPDDTDTDTASDDDSYAVPDDDADSGREPWPPDDCFYTRCANPPEPEPEPECVLDESVINSDAEKYFGFKGVGLINAEGTQDPEWASLVNVALKGIDGKDIHSGNAYSFFYETTLTADDGTGMPAVALEAIGVDSTLPMGLTRAFAYFPIHYLDLLAEYEGVLPLAPTVQIFDVVFTSDNAYAKQCLIAENKYGMNEVFGVETAVGRFQVCYKDNYTFEVGKTFKVVMNAELETVQKAVDTAEDTDEDAVEYTDEDAGEYTDEDAVEYTDENIDEDTTEDTDKDAEPVDDPCTCYKTEDWSVVDCSEISWE